MMTLEQHGPDTYAGTGPSYPWGGLYGGQIVAQSLRAAAATVDPGFEVHSLHSYFIRTGDSSQPIRFEVDRLRNGRSFVTRQVVARQPVGAIFQMAVSFQTPEEAPEVQAATMRDLPGPDEVTSETWSPVFDRRFVPNDEPGRATAWLRMTEPMGDDPLLHACALAYESDDMPTDAVVSLHPDRPEDRNFESYPFFSASLDHAIWFHRPFRADEWLLYTQDSPNTHDGLGFSRGLIFRADGTLVASVAQEGSIRVRRTKPSAV